MTTLEPIASAGGGFSAKRYAQLLVRFVPKAIETETETENEAALAIVESLMEKGDDGRSAEEEALLELLIELAGHYEERNHVPFPEGGPVEALTMLMESHGMKAIDLTREFGSRGRVSDVLSGRRAISKEQAKRLAERFKVSPAVRLKGRCLGSLWFSRVQGSGIYGSGSV